jgi:hypothetical protein
VPPLRRRLPVSEGLQPGAHVLEGRAEAGAAPIEEHRPLSGADQCVARMSVAVNCGGAERIEGEELAPELRQYFPDAAHGAEPAPQAEEILVPGHGLQELRGKPGPLGKLALVVPA